MCVDIVSAYGVQNSTRKPDRVVHVAATGLLRTFGPSPLDTSNPVHVGHRRRGSEAFCLLIDLRRSTQRKRHDVNDRVRSCGSASVEVAHETNHNKRATWVMESHGTKQELNKCEKTEG